MLINYRNTTTELRYTCYIVVAEQGLFLSARPAVGGINISTCVVAIWQSDICSFYFSKVPLKSTWSLGSSFAVPIVSYIRSSPDPPQNVPSKSIYVAYPRIPSLLHRLYLRLVVVIVPVLPSSHAIKPSTRLQHIPWYSTPF